MSTFVNLNELLFKRSQISFHTDDPVNACVKTIKFNTIVLFILLVSILLLVICDFIFMLFFDTNGLLMTIVD